MSDQDFAHLMRLLFAGMGGAVVGTLIGGMIAIVIARILFAFAELFD
jgi:ABC-type lipoprotein release transport system permease subunit